MATDGGNAKATGTVTFSIDRNTEDPRFTGPAELVNDFQDRITLLETFSAQSTVYTLNGADADLQVSQCVCNVSVLPSYIEAQWL